MRILGSYHYVTIPSGTDISARELGELVDKGVLKRGRVAILTRELDFFSSKLAEAQANAGRRKLRIGVEGNREVASGPFSRIRRGGGPTRWLLGISKITERNGGHVVFLESDGIERLLWQLQRYVNWMKTNDEEPTFHIIKLTDEENAFCRFAVSKARKTNDFNLGNFLRAIKAYRSFKLAERAAREKCDLVVLGAPHIEHLRLAGAPHEIEASPLAAAWSQSESRAIERRRELAALEKYRSAIEEALSIAINVE